MRNTKRLPDRVLSDIEEHLMENKGLLSGTQTTDEVINSATNEQLLAWYLTWNGIHGFTQNILSIFEVNDDED